MANSNVDIALIYSCINSQGLYHLGTSSGTGVDGYWSGFFSNENTTVGSGNSLAGIWSIKTGVFLFLTETPNDNFISNLQSFLSEQPQSQTLRFLWIENPNVSYNYWNYQAITTVVSETNPREELIAKQTQFKIGN